MKTVKRATACLLVVLLCLSLCSCNYLDEMRAAHAIIREDGTILWNNAEYRPLPIQDQLVWEKYELIFDRGGTFFVTTEDVPVLLSETYGRYGSSYNVGTILNAYHDEVPGVAYYCLSSQYGKITKELEQLQKQVELNDSGLGNLYYYNFWYEKNGDTITETYYLTEEQEEAVNTVMTTVEPIIPDEPIGMEFNVILYSEETDDNGSIFTGNLMLAAATHNYYFSAVNEDYEHYYPVPEEYNSIFDDIFFAKWNAFGINTEKFPSRDQQNGGE